LLFKKKKKKVIKKKENVDQGNTNPVILQLCMLIEEVYHALPMLLLLSCKLLLDWNRDKGADTEFMQVI